MKQKFILSMLLCLAAATLANAHDFQLDGICYDINGNEVSVTYQGYDNVHTGHYSGDIVIPETVTYGGVTYTVTGIKRGAFSYGTDSLTVSIPKTVTSIATFSFSGASGVTSITIDSENPVYDSRDNCNAIIRTADNYLLAGCQNTIIPNTVTTIGNGAFWGCTSLTSVTIPNSVTKLSVQAFAYCRGLLSVTIPSSVVFIDQAAFSNCSALESITVDSDNPCYDSRDNCNAIILTESNMLVFGCKNSFIPNTVTSIGSWAFEYCADLKSITIPNSVTTIRDHAFLSCSGLTSITIPSSVTSIGDYAFSSCTGLSIVIIPKSVIYLGYNPFSSCVGLTSLGVQRGNPRYDSRDDCNAIIEKASNTLITGCQNTTIPSTVTCIGRSSFSGCINLKSLTIPSSIIAIEDYAFQSCSGLKDVYSYITNLTQVSMGTSLFTQEYNNRTLHVPYGMAADYRANNDWYSYFHIIVEMDPVINTVPGDINGDSEVNIADINALIDMILAGKTSIVDNPAADVNRDRSINICDINAIVDLILASDQ